MTNSISLRTRLAGVALLTSALVAVAPEAFAQEAPPPEPVLVLPETSDPALPNVRIIGIGGTITSSAVGRDKWQSYGGPSVPIGEILGRLQPEITTVANVSVLELSSIGSAAITTEYLYDLTKTVDENLAADDVDAVIVTTGTNVMEEVAYWLDLTLRSDKPVVLTGSMRQQNTLSFDGEANLFNAIMLAASEETTCFGPVLMLSDEFTAAREVTKTDAVRIDTFGGQRTGVLGFIDENRVRTVHAPARVTRCGTPEWQTPFDLTTITPEDFATVEIVYSYVDAGGITVSALADAGVDGIVTAGHGAGGISSAQGQARTAATEQGVLFVAANRTGSGSVYTNQPGIIGAGDLMPQKARMLLQLGLTFSDEPEQIREWFTTVGMPEFDFGAN